jgi:hypothetical protein
MGCVMRENRGSKYNFQVAMVRLITGWLIWQACTRCMIHTGVGLSRDYVILTQCGTCESFHKHDTTCTNCIYIHQWGWLYIIGSQCQWTAVHVLLSLVLWIEKNTRPVIWEKKYVFILCGKNIRFLFINERMKFYIFWRYAGLVLYRSVSIA